MDEQLTGRALDAAVAEHVIGWTRMPWKKEKGVLEGEFMWKTPGDEGLYPAELPRYSTTWEGMGLVVEEMKRRGWRWAAFDESSGYLCSFVRDDEEEIYASAPTAPEAVARAALLALSKGGPSDG